MMASSVRKVRPSAGCTPSTSKNAGETAPAASLIGSPTPVRSAFAPLIAAIPSKAPFILDQSRKSAGETTLSSTPSASRFSNTITSRSGSAYGSGRSRMALTAEKIAVLAPIPSASVRMAMTVTPGCLTRSRSA